MTANILSLASRLFDAIDKFFGRPASQKNIAKVFLWTYLLALAAVECRLRGLLPEGLARLTPASHVAAIQMAFTLILAMEILELILAIPDSFSRSMGKQLEILALIHLRNAFKELSHLPEPVVAATGTDSLAYICATAAAALCIFAALGCYCRMAGQRRHAATCEQIPRYIACKKLLALVLLAIFALAAGMEFWEEMSDRRDLHFFETIYTALIFSDIAVVLLAQQFMPSFHAVFRNSGFVMGTLLMRLSFSTEHPLDIAVSLFATVYVLALTYAVSRFPPSLLHNVSADGDDKRGP
jgi:hypothetical protein